jgi:hypothetical protein
MKDFRDFPQKLTDDRELAEEARAATATLDAAMVGEQPERLAKAAPVTFTKLSHDHVETPETFPVLRPDPSGAILAETDTVTAVLEKQFEDFDLELLYPEVAAFSRSGSDRAGDANMRKIHGITDDAPAAPFVSVRSTPELRKAAGANLSGEGVFQGRRYRWELVGAGDDEHIAATWI